MIFKIFIIPMMLIIIGYLMFKKPPKKINFFIGYRTSKSMKDEKSWKLANQYCGKIWINTGIITILINILLSFLIYLKLLLLTESLIVIITVFQIVILLSTVFIVENKLKSYK